MTRTPWSITQDDIDRLRSVGLNDRAINDATQVISFFNYINRVADGLGVDLEEGMPAPPNDPHAGRQKKTRHQHQTEV